MHIQCLNVFVLCPVSEEEVSHEAQEMEMARDRYVDDLQLALTGEGPAALDYTFHLTAERGQGGRGSTMGLHLSYEKVQKDISVSTGPPSFLSLHPCIFPSLASLSPSQ